MIRRVHSLFYKSILLYPSRICQAVTLRMGITQQLSRMDTRKVQELK